MGVTKPSRQAFTAPVGHPCHALSTVQTGALTRGVTTAIARRTFGVDFAVGLFLIALLALALVAPSHFLVFTWVTVSSVVTLLAGVRLLEASLNSTYSEDNRAPELRIAIAAAAFAVALPTAFAAIQRLRGRPGRLGLAAGVMLTVTATVLLLLLTAVTLLSGRT